MENFIAHLKEVIPEKDSLKLVKKEAENYYKQHSLDECFATGLELYQSENFQIQEVGVFLGGYAACKNTSALSFLKDTVSQHKSWKVQEILAMAFPIDFRTYSLSSSLREDKNCIAICGCSLK